MVQAGGVMKQILTVLFSCFIMGCDSEDEHTRKAKSAHADLLKLMEAQANAHREIDFLKYSYAGELHEEAEKTVRVGELRTALRNASVPGEVALLRDDLSALSAQLQKLTRKNDETFKQMEDFLQRFPDAKRSNMLKAIDRYRFKLILAAQSHGESRDGIGRRERMDKYWRLSLMSDFDAQWFLDEFGKSEAD